jgi:hypothetical protein
LDDQQKRDANAEGGIFSHIDVDDDKAMKILHQRTIKEKVFVLIAKYGETA